MIARPRFSPASKYADSGPICERLEHVMTLLEAILTASTTVVTVTAKNPPKK